MGAKDIIRKIIPVRASVFARYRKGVTRDLRRITKSQRRAVSAVRSLERHLSSIERGVMGANANIDGLRSSQADLLRNQEILMRMLIELGAQGPAPLTTLRSGEPAGLGATNAGGYDSEIIIHSQSMEPYVWSKSDSEILDICLNYEKGLVDTGYPSLEKLELVSSDGEIQWQIPHQSIKNENTFKLYFYGLRTAYFLARGYEITGNEFYLRFAVQLVDSFLRFYTDAQCGEAVIDPMLDNDHAQAERIQNLVYLHRALDQSSMFYDDSGIVSLVRLGLKGLKDPARYQKNHNHGIIADNACLIAVGFLNEPDKRGQVNWIVERLKKQMAHAFTAEGVHCENSTDYHYVVMQLAISSFQTLVYLGHPYAKDIEILIKEGLLDYCVYSTKPNGQRAAFGDSRNQPANQLPGLEDSRFRYVLTGGREGEKPSALFRVFKKSGYAFLRSSFDQDDFDLATWIAVRAGYSTRVHKHADDLSLCLYSRGYDVFIDPGMYNYVHGDPLKKYMESAAAHTTISMDGGSGYSIGSGNGPKFSILEARQSEDEFSLLMYGAGYEGCTIYRQIIYQRALDVIVVHDQLFSRDVHNWEQYFHLSKDVSIEACDEGYARIAIADTGFVAELTQVHSCDKIEVLHGRETQPYSIQSTGFGSYVDTDTLVYSKRAQEASFVTVVDIRKESDGRCEAILKDDLLTVGKEGRVWQVKLECQKPLEMSPVACTLQEGDTLALSDSGSDFSSHRLRAFGRREKRWHDTSAQAALSDLALSLPRDCDDEGWLLYTIAKKSGEQKSALVASYKIDDTKLDLVPFKDPQVPRITGTKSDVRDGAYLFAIDLKYPAPVSAKWWVYSGGANVHFEMGDKLELSYKPEAPGTYIVLCSLTDPFFGEFFYYEFEPFVVS